MRFCDFLKISDPKIFYDRAKKIMHPREKIFLHTWVQLFLFFQFLIFRTVQDKPLLLSYVNEHTWTWLQVREDRDI